jgi:hypothetical protein
VALTEGDLAEQEVVLELGHSSPVAVRCSANGRVVRRCSMKC